MLQKPFESRRDAIFVEKRHPTDLSPVRAVSHQLKELKKEKTQFLQMDTNLSENPILTSEKSEQKLNI